MKQVLKAILYYRQSMKRKPKGIIIHRRNAHILKHRKFIDGIPVQYSKVSPLNGVYIL